MTRLVQRIRLCASTAITASSILSRTALHLFAAVFEGAKNGFHPDCGCIQSIRDRRNFIVGGFLDTGAKISSGEAVGKLNNPRQASGYSVREKSGDQNRQQQGQQGGPEQLRRTMWRVSSNIVQGEAEAHDMRPPGRPHRERRWAIARP